MSQINNTNNSMLTLTPSTGGVVSPTPGGTINIVGGSGIAVIGNPGTNTITIEDTGAVPGTFVTDSGNASPSGGIIEIFGAPGGSITTTGSGNEINIAVAGATEYAVQVGAANGALFSVPLGTNGQVLIGASADNPEFASLTSSSGSLAFTPGPNSLDINVVGGGIQWQTVTANTNMVTNNGYITEGITQLLMTLPATSSIGDSIQIVDSGNAGMDSPWRINGALNQAIFASGNNTMSSGGYVEVVGGSNAAEFSCILLRCVTANKFWVVEYAIAQLNFV